ncbi:MAG: hypothetical protein JKY01_06540 [Pseudomonadales bacterium]|nr:hypothetical protein [Pseudomonadales bacterium]
MKKIRIMCRGLVSKSLLAALALGAGGLAWGHGGVSMKDDMCLMKVGNYKVHFTGYQPQARATQEFCEDIPVVSKAIFVMDFIDDELRKMDVDFRVINDVKAIGVKAVLADLGTKEEIEKNTAFYYEGEQFLRGTMAVTIDFKKEGQYIGLVTAKNPETGREYTSVFPFSVGVINYAKYVVPIVLILVLTIVFFGIFLYKWKKHESDREEAVS